MNITVTSRNDLNEFQGIIIPMYEANMKVEGIDLPLEQLAKSEKFTGKVSTYYTTSMLVEGNIQEVVLVGLGKEGDLSYRKLLNTLADAYRKVKATKVETVAFTYLNSNVEANEMLIKATIEALGMADYTFNDFKSDKKDKNIKVEIIVDEEKINEEMIEEAKLLVSSNLIARDLVNQPANVMHPESLAERSIELGKEFGFEVEVLDVKAIEELGMEAYLAVAKASTIEPKFIIMRYQGNDDDDQRLGLVGKGLTYDSGGLSIKPTPSMVNMKDDMGGSAAVIGAMCAIAGSKMKKNVTAVVAACENMIAGNSYKPGDIIGSMGGKSIFIGNTDAEGRLTLIDAMHYIVTKENVNKVLDIATLTGAAIHCTGSAASVAISNNDAFYQTVQKGFDLSGEQIWRMPIFDEYKELIKHQDADLTNTAGSPGTITAGLFIGEFNGDLPWVHVDIAGTIWSTKQAGVLSKGATGIAVRPLYYLAKHNM